MIEKTADLAVPTTISPLNKGLGHLPHPIDREAIAKLGWNLLKEDISLPSAVLYEDKLSHNLDWMQRFIDAYGIQLAPHGKTTMAPALFRRQIERGAWGITLATAHQTLVACQHGVRRVLMANQLIGRENMAIIARLLQDPGFTYFCLVDSADQVDQLGAYFSKHVQRLQVLLELGVTGGRSGVRDEEQLHSVLAALSRWTDCIALSGIEIYEGVLDEEASIRAFLHRAVDVTKRLAVENLFHREPIIISGAGSAWYDVVAEVFSGAGFGKAPEIVLRPGCYLTHDVGAYREAQAKILERNPIAHQMHSGLVPALNVWSYVHSVPEAGEGNCGSGQARCGVRLRASGAGLAFQTGRSGSACGSGKLVTYKDDGSACIFEDCCRG